MSETQAQRIVLASRPNGMPTHTDFRVESVALPELAEDQILVKSLYISVDPYMRGRMSEAKSYVPPYQIGDPIIGGTIAEVIESKSANFQVGDIVDTQIGWQTHAVCNAKSVRKINPELGPVTASLGILGVTGLTAYFGLIDICNPQPGETVVVSGAAGAVGMTVGQIAKILGCRVVGTAGSDEKVTYLKDELGFDEVINYRTVDNIHHAMRNACPDGIDVYFDNVGGEITDAVFRNLNNFSRISICGQIAHYNAQKPELGPRILQPILTNRAMVKGFIIMDYAKRFPEGVKQLATWVKEGKLQYEETIVDGFDHTIDAFLGLFSGANLGKQLVRV